MMEWLAWEPVLVDCADSRLRKSFYELSGVFYLSGSFI
jgi:hypothetical protein